jgi:two-component system, NarL family, nitrate/nitrite response regulator NarL
MPPPPVQADHHQDQQPLRVVIAHPHALLRRGLSSGLDREDQITVVGEAEHATVLLEAVRHLDPNVIVVDLDLPGIAVPGSLHQLQEAAPHSRVLVLADEEHEDALVHVIRSGGGYLTHGYTTPSLAHAVQALGRGEIVFPRNMLRGLLDRLLTDHEERELAIRKVALLSERERDVLRLLTEGANNDVIAEALVISPQTARTHIQNILVKMDLHSRLEAMAYVRKHQLGPELSRHARGTR